MMVQHLNAEDRNKLKKRMRSPLFPDFHFEKVESKNLGITAIGRLFCHRSGVRTIRILSLALHLLKEGEPPWRCPLRQISLKLL